MMEPPVMLWVISFSPGFIFSILAGVVCEGQVGAVPTGPCLRLTLEYLQHLKKGVMRTRPTL